MLGFEVHSTTILCVRRGATLSLEKRQRALSATIATAQKDIK